MGIAVVDGATLEVVAEFYLLSEEPGVACYAETDRLFLTGEGDSYGLWAIDCAQGRPMWGLHDAVWWLEKACIDPTRGKLYYAEYECGLLIVVDLATRRVTANLFPPVDDPWVENICVNGRIGKAYMTTMYGTGLAVFDCEGDTFLGVAEPPVPRGMLSLACAESAGVVACAVDGERAALMFDCHADTFTQVVALPASAETLIADPDGATVYAACDTWLVRIDTRTGEVTGEMALGGPLGEVCIAPRQNKLYVADQTQPGIHVVTRDVDSLVGWIPSDFAVDRMQCDAEGGRVYFTCERDSRVGVVDCRQDTIVQWIEADLQGDHTSLIYWPHGDRLYATCEDSVRVIECSGARTQTLPRSFYYPTISPPLPALNMLCVWEPEGYIALVEDRMPARPGVARVRSKTTPTVSKGALYVSRRGPAYLYDRTGRLAAMLGPGDNDVSGLRSGVYFLRRTRDALATKVIITN